jgi:hypothetical protein
VERSGTVGKEEEKKERIQRRIENNDMNLDSIRRPEPRGSALLHPGLSLIRPFQGLKESILDSSTR